MRKILLATMAFILLAAASTGLYYRDVISEVYQTAKIFKEENLVESFRNMYKLRPSRRIARAGDIFDFSTQPTELPDTFTYNGTTQVLEDFLSDTVATSLLVVVDDAIRFEQYYLGSDENSLFASHSMSKSVVSALVGIAIKNGDVGSVDDPVTQYIPELKGTSFDGVTIKHCLQMSSGIAFNEDYSDLGSDINRMSVAMLSGTPFTEFLATLKREKEPGTFNRYVSVNTEILGIIVANATGKGLAAYLQENIWQHIGAEHDAWWILNNDRELAMGGLSISTRDYARFARLYLNMGNWNGQQLIPAQWVVDSIATDEAHLKPGENPLSDSKYGYGYQWWIPEGVEREFMGLGIYGQNIYVNIDRKLVIVKTAANPHFQQNDFEADDIALEAYRSIGRQFAP